MPFFFFFPLISNTFAAARGLGITVLPCVPGSSSSKSLIRKIRYLHLYFADYYLNCIFSRRSWIFCRFHGCFDSVGSFEMSLGICLILCTCSLYKMHYATVIFPKFDCLILNCVCVCVFFLRRSNCSIILVLFFYFCTIVLGQSLIFSVLGSFYNCVLCFLFVVPQRAILL